jgi:hypothetical protein
MLAAAYREGVDLSFPLLATPKIDGVRALVVDGRLVSRSFKLIPNVALRAALETMLPEGADGEISCGSSLYDTTSAVMSEHHVTKKNHVQLVRLGIRPGRPVRRARCCDKRALATGT